MAGRGVLVLVVGPSGAGKDTLIRLARDRFANDASFVFARRIVTRTSIPSVEDHDSIDAAEFEKRISFGQFLLHWQAHGLRYGIDAQLEQELSFGHIVIANVSREVVKEAASRREFDTVAVTVTAAPEVCVDRIIARGREDRDAALRRVSRKATPLPPSARQVTIDNSGDLASAASLFCSLLSALRDEVRATATVAG